MKRKTGWAAVITFLAQLNGERAFILEIDDSLLDNTCPGDTERHVVRKAKKQKKSERKQRESLIVGGVQ